MAPSRVIKTALSQAKTGFFMIFNSMLVHQALAAFSIIPNLRSLTARNRNDVTGWLKSEWKKVINVDYQPIFKPAEKLLTNLPPHPFVNDILNMLADVACKIVNLRALLKHDIAGRLYHKLLLRKVAKGLSTKYTSIPAAVLLSQLAIELFDRISNVKWDDLKSLSKVKICDLACGSGTLLSAIYSSIMDFHIKESERPDAQELHKVLLEEVLWGFDVLDYAVHLAASTLVLHEPRKPINKMNIYILPLGLRNNRPFLGSLDVIVEGDSCVFPVYATLNPSDNSSMPVRVSVRETREEPLKMKRPTVIIMNPPFARTGNIGKTVLFGYLEEAERRQVLDKLRKLLNKAGRELEGRIGRAGLGAAFIYKADKCLKDGGVLASVLPRVTLSGTDWKPIRKLLASEYTIKYIIVCDDPDHGWAWSEETELGEILLVAVKSRPEGNSGATIVFVRKRPQTSLEAKVYAKEIIRQETKLNYTNGFSSTYLDENKRISLYRIRQCMLTTIPNWNVAIGFRHSFLSEVAFLLFDRRFLNYRLPLIRIPKLIEPLAIRFNVPWKRIVGYDVASVKRMLGKGRNPIFYLSKIRNRFSKLELEEDLLEQQQVPDECARTAAHLLIAGVGRFRLQTTSLIAVYTRKKAISSVAWSVPLPSVGGLTSLDVAKIQVMWLNSTLGFMHYLSLRQDHQGPVIQFKKDGLEYLYLVDVKRLPKEDVEELLELFERLKNKRFADIETQLREAEEHRGMRYEIDRVILKAFTGRDIESDDELHEHLMKIYQLLRGETLIRRTSRGRY